MALNLTVLLFYAISFVYMYKLICEYGIDRLVACLGALSFTFAGSITHRFVHYDEIVVICTTSLCFWLAERAAVRKTISYLLVLGLVMGNNLIAGNPQVGAYLALSVFFFILRAHGNITTHVMYLKELFCTANLS